MKLSSCFTSYVSYQLLSRWVSFMTFPPGIPMTTCVPPSVVPCHTAGGRDFRCHKTRLRTSRKQTLFQMMFRTSRGSLNITAT